MCVREGMKFSVDISEKKKRPKDKAALKSNRASTTGATARVQAQRCNKEQGDWMRDEGGGGLERCRR